MCTRTPARLGLASIILSAARGSHCAGASPSWSPCSRSGRRALGLLASHAEAPGSGKRKKK
eukprot:1023398-Alexandrium_andersonii.AAC.1